MKNVVKLLIKLNKTVSTMESCTGGCLANEITNVPGASDIFKFGAVTYANEFKIKMGVDSRIIDKYSVYSMETAVDMAKKITFFTLSDYGIGVTGKLKRKDKNNLYSSDNLVFISIYDKKLDKSYNYSYEVVKSTRASNKKDLVKFIESKFMMILSESVKNFV